MTPSDALFGRCYREFGKRNFSVHPLNKVKTKEYQGTILTKRKRVPLAPGAAMHFDQTVEPPDTDFISVLEVLVALQVLVNAWALTCTKETTSADGRYKGRDGDYKEGFSYYAWATDRAMSHPGPEPETVAWLLDRDRQTRTKARALTSDGTPWCIALRIAREIHLAVMWTVGGVGVSQATPVAVPDQIVRAEMQAEDERRGDRYAHVVAGMTAEDCCPDFNSACGCRKQTLCPHALWHRCSQKLPDGTLCGQGSHGKSTCRRNPKNNNSDGRKGGKSGKGSNQGGTGGNRDRGTKRRLPLSGRGDKSRR